MAENESTITQDPAATATTEPQQTHSESQVDETADKLNNLKLRICSPSQRTHDAVINRLIETLSSQSVLSKRYGTIPEGEASSVAKSIEEEAFSVTGEKFPGDDDDDIEILQSYSREISKRVLDTVKARPAPASATACDAPSGTETANGEEVLSSSVKAEA